MGRTSNIDKKNLFTYNKTSNTSKCILCEKQLRGNILGNMKRHYEIIHKYNFAEVGCAATTSGQNAFKRSTPNQFGAKLNKNEFLKCCVGLVAMRHVSFGIFDDELYFRRLLEPYEKQFNLHLSAENIEAQMRLSADAIRDCLRGALCGKMLSLKVDVATRRGKSILAMNIQYIRDFKIVTHTIGWSQLKARSTATFLKNAIFKCLQEYDIEHTQLYSTTTDNVAQMPQVAQLLQQQVQHLQDAEFEAFRECEESDVYEVVHDNLRSLLTAVRSAAHALQLAADDAFEDMQHQLVACRKVVGILSSNPEAAELCLPPYDNLSRWHSTFVMLESLLNLKQRIAADELGFEVDCKIDWNFIENFVHAFAPVAQCTQQLQAAQYIAGDFYRDWLVCEAKLKKIAENKLAVRLLESLRQGKEKLLGNVALLAGLYFDPRFNFRDSPYIDEEQKKRAVLHILGTNNALNSLNGERNVANDVKRITQQQEDASFLSPHDPYNILEEELHTLTGNSLTMQNDANIRQKLENLAYGQRMPFATDVLEYWKTASVQENDLYKLAAVVLALPASQASVERAFSALSTINTQQSSSLSSDSLSDLLIVQLNNDLLQNVNL